MDDAQLIDSPGNGPLSPLSSSPTIQTELAEWRNLRGNMPTRLVSVTPLPVRWPHPIGPVTRNISIIDRPTFREENWRFWNLRRTEEEAIDARSHWLCIESEAEWNDHTILQTLADDLRTAVLGFQLWAPVGWAGFIIDCAETHGGLTVELVHVPEGYAKPLWGRMLDIGKLDPGQLPALINGTFQAIESGAVPLVNPFRFLEIGFQTAVHHRRAGAVLWTMGLDGLLSAESSARFSQRLQKLLGKDKRVFPEDRAGRRPKYTVSDLAESMFEFRSLIAHGKEILQKYREPIQFEFETAEFSHLTVEKWSRGTLIIEGIVFTLIAALRKVIDDGLMQTMRTQRAWKKWLDSAI